jgi:hypothetical protein
MDSTLSRDPSESPASKFTPWWKALSPGNTYVPAGIIACLQALEGSIWIFSGVA